MAFRLAICGMGRVSTYARDAIAQHPDLELVAACDPIESRAVSAAAGVAGVAGVAAFPDLAHLLAEMSAQDDLDAVVISTPLSAHAPEARRALEAGLPVLIEKPTAPSLEEWLALCAQAERSGVPLHTAFHARFAPNLDWLVDALPHRIAAHGPITSVHALLWDPYVVPPGPGEHHGGTIIPDALSLGGSWLDSGINALSVLDRLLDDLQVETVRQLPWHGSPLPIDAAPIEAPPMDMAPIEDVAATATITFGTPRRTGTIETSWAAEFSFKRTVLQHADGHRTRLEHSTHAVWDDAPDGAQNLLVRYPLTRRRLFTHYAGVFDEFARVLGGAPDNRSLSTRLHRLLHHRPRLAPPAPDR